jgi:hypothetical protein
MSLIPWWVKVLVVMAVVGACGWAIHLYDEGIREEQKAADDARYNQALIKAQEAAKAQELVWRKQTKETQDATVKLLAAKDAAVTTATATIGSLRNQLSSARSSLSSATITACRARATTLYTIFGECAERYVEMAKAAEGQRIDAVDCRARYPQ